MSRERFERMDAIFREAVRLAADQRAVYLDEACGDDAALREEVAALLAEDRATRGALDDPALGPAAGGEASPVARAFDALDGDRAGGSAESTGSRIGPYHLLEEIGEGGFGVVFMAEQTEPVRRRVALKVIKLGMDTRQVIARFEAERQALAMMDHPHIATVLDAGATASGRPYFVMELCAGTPITEYCREHQLPIPARLELAGQVCRAVQHAHQKGVIHRDIKPGNVLVETRDGRPFVRVIDFGIAKATDARLTAQTYFTEHRQMIGTPEYMSPEQAEGLPDVDTRTDVYALGVLLYELLTGTTPHDARELRSAAWGEIQRIIREVEPPPPSTRRTRAGGVAPGPDTGDAPRPPRGELDWIVMKALAKDRSRRYQSASELAADLEHHLAGRPVSAAPPSRVYRARSFVRRNRGLVAGTTILVTVLAAGVVGTSWGLIEAVDAREQADDAARAADARAAEVELVAGFQAAQIAGLDPAAVGARMRRSVQAEFPGEAGDAGPGGPGGVDDVGDVNDVVRAALEAANFTNVAMTTLREDFLQRSLNAATSEFVDQPLVQARLFQTIANTARDLGLLDFAEAPQADALRIREQQLGAEAPPTIESLSGLVLLRLQQSRFDDAEEPGRRSMELHRRVLGDTAETNGSIGAYGAILRGLERLDEALPYYEEAFEGTRRLNGPDHPNTMIYMNNMGFIYRALGRLDDANRMFQETLEARQRAFGPDDSRTLSSMMNLGGMLRQAGRFEEAEPMYRGALAGHRRIHGDDHQRTLTSLGNLGVFLLTAGRADEAVPTLQEAVDGHRRVLGLEAQFTNIYTVHLGHALVRAGELDEAETVLRDVLERVRASFGDEFPTVIRSELGLAILTRERGETPAALVELEALRDRATQIGGADWPFTQEIERVLAETRAGPEA